MSSRQPIVVPGTQHQLKSDSIYVSNLDAEIGEDELRNEIFTDCGVITSVVINYDRNGRSQGTATITFANSTDAQKACTEFDGAHVDGKIMSVKLVGALTTPTVVVKKTATAASPAPRNTAPRPVTPRNAAPRERDNQASRNAPAPRNAPEPRRGSAREQRPEPRGARAQASPARARVYSDSSSGSVDDVVSVTLRFIPNAKLRSSILLVICLKCGDNRTYYGTYVVLYLID